MEQLLLGEDMYEVQEIVGIKKSQGRLLYRVRWRGYGSQSDTWEPEENLMLCRDMIQEYLEHQAAVKMNNSKSWDSKASSNEGENQPASVSRDTNDSESESFWQQDMYSRVKGRAAKRHQSRQASGISSRRKRGRAQVLQTLSQSYDNARKLPSPSSTRSKPVTAQLSSSPRIPKSQFAERTAHQPATSKNSSTSDPLVDGQTEAVECIKTEGSEATPPEPSQAKPSIGREDLKEALYNPQNAKFGTEDDLHLNLQAEVQKVADGMDPVELQKLLSTSKWSSKAYEILSSCQLWQLEILFRYGADVNARHQVTRATLLMTASEKGLTEVIQLLLKCGAHKDATDIQGRTALMMACSGGHVEVAQELLGAGANFGAMDKKGHTAHSLVHPVREALDRHISLVTLPFVQQVNCTLSNEVKMVEALFPLQCLSVCEASRFQIHFQHRTQAPKPGIGYLLFIAVAAIFRESVECRLYGRTPVLSVDLNGSKQISLTENGENFVFPFSPLQDGENVLTIMTLHLPKSELKILVCAYNAELTSHIVPGTSEDGQDVSKVS